MIKSPAQPLVVYRTLERKVVTKDESKQIGKKNEELRTDSVAFVDICVVLKMGVRKKGRSRFLTTSHIVSHRYLAYAILLFTIAQT